jgi:hypothetical protein
MPELVYAPIPELGPSEIEEAIVRDEPSELLLAVLSADLYLEDSVSAEDICIRLSKHKHFNVRGNALLGFAHIARIHGKLDENKVEPLILDGMKDSDDYVRGHATDAREDVEHYLGWKF